MYKTNYAAIVVAAVAHWIVGALWFSPWLFSDAWIRANGFTPEQLEKMGTPISSFVLTFLGPLLTAYVLALVIRYARVVTALGGAAVGCMLAAGFVAAENLPLIVMAHRPNSTALFMIESGYAVVGCIVMGAILGAWAKPAAEAEAKRMAA